MVESWVGCHFRCPCLSLQPRKANQVVKEPLPPKASLWLLLHIPAPLQASQGQIGLNFDPVSITNCVSLSKVLNFLKSPRIIRILGANVCDSSGFIISKSSKSSSCDYTSDKFLSFELAVERVRAKGKE